MSLDGIKKNNPGRSLMQFYNDTFGYDFEEARKNFMDSLAAYSILCYLLQIKDRFILDFYTFFEFFCILGIMGISYLTLKAILSTLILASSFQLLLVALTLSQLHSS